MSEEQGLIIAGTEDNQIRFFDLNSHKQVKSYVAHTDSITSLLIPTSKNQSTLMSGSHDGMIRAWDLRTFHLLFDTTAHRRKYDEGVLCLASYDKYPLVASGKNL